MAIGIGIRKAIANANGKPKSSDSRTNRAVINAISRLL